MVPQGCRSQRWDNSLSFPSLPPQMHSPTRGLGRVMVFLAAALASASLAVPEGWGEEGEHPRLQQGTALPAWGHGGTPKKGTDQTTSVPTLQMPSLPEMQPHNIGCPLASLLLKLPIAQPQLGPVFPSSPRAAGPQGWHAGLTPLCVSLQVCSTARWGRT